MSRKIRPAYFGRRDLACATANLTPADADPTPDMVVPVDSADMTRRERRGLKRVMKRIPRGAR